MQTITTTQAASKKSYAIFQSACKYFLIASEVAFFGWLFETVSFLIMYGEPIDRGMLTLPFCYLYGTTVLLTYFLLGTPFTGRMGKLYGKLCKASSSSLQKFCVRILQILLYFVMSTILATAVELLVGLIFVNKFDIPLWSYGNFEHCYKGVICLEFSLLWGTMLTIGMSTLWHIFVWLESLLSPRARIVVAVLLAILVSADFVFNCIYFATTGVHFQLF